MKKSIIAAIVGGIIIFAWQFLSWAAMNMHKKANGYTPNNMAIMAALEANLPEEGGYMLPGLPETATKADHEKMMKESNGKPWATVQYHKSGDTTPKAMVMNMVRALLVDIVMVWLFCWLIGKMNMPGFGTIFTASIAMGFIVFFNTAYIGHIWYKFFDIMAYFMDAMVSWGVCGLWLGWYLKKK
jgi:hypothetical protein